MKENLDNSDLDSNWITNVSDHFCVMFNINTKANNSDEIKQSWRLNSDKWDIIDQYYNRCVQNWKMKLNILNYKLKQI